MDPRTASPRTPDPVALEFVRFCYRRRQVGWPELYDEMCAVAARGLFKGMDADDLAGLGIGFSLFDMPALSILAGGVITEEQAKRRPVAVAVIAELPPLVIEDAPDAVGEVIAVEAAAAEAVQADVSGHTMTQPKPVGRDERTFDVVIRAAAVAV
jgi:hypothetical protein